MVLLELNCPLRTDESFLELAVTFMVPKTEHSDDDDIRDEHVVGISPLFVCQTGMVSQFRLDGMHLIDKGVSLRLFKYWAGKEKSVSILRKEEIKIVTERLEIVYQFLPEYFNRKFQGFEFVHLYKCTEL